jgi:hypothetical protein
MRNQEDLREWADLRERLRKVVHERGPYEVAAEIPIGKSTLFRLLNGQTEAPSLPSQACIERFVDDRDLADEREHRRVR